MKLLTKKETAVFIGCHPEHLMRLVRKGKFPKPIRTGDNKNCSVRFLSTEIEDWVQARMAARKSDEELIEEWMQAKAAGIKTKEQK